LTGNIKWILTFHTTPSCFITCTCSSVWNGVASVWTLFQMYRVQSAAHEQCGGARLHSVPVLCLPAWTWWTIRPRGAIPTGLSGEAPFFSSFERIYTHVGVKLCLINKNNLIHINSDYLFNINVGSNYFKMFLCDIIVMIQLYPHNVTFALFSQFN